MNKNLSAKSITDSAILIAITWIIVLIGNFLGFTILVTTIAFIPLALIFIKHSAKFWGCGSLVTSILVMLFTGIINGIFLMIPIIILSLIYGYCIKKNIGGGTTLIYLIIGTMISLSISCLLYIYVFFNMGAVEAIQKYIIDFYNPIFQESAKMAGSNASQKIDQMQKVLTVKNILILIPTVFTIYGFILSIISVSIANKTLKRIGIKINQISNFSKWYIDPMIALVLIVVDIFGIMLVQNGLTIGNDIIFSSMILLLGIYSIEGLSLICFLITKNSRLGESKILPVVLFFIMLLMGSMAVLFAGILGLVDLFMDTRGVNKNSILKLIIKNS